MPAPGSSRATESELIPAEVAEVVRLYSLRSWIEQSYKQVKNSLGWAHYQVRSDLAIRRHWQLVCCAFTFCWWANTDLLLEEELGGRSAAGGGSRRRGRFNLCFYGAEGGKEGRKPASSVLARGTKEGEDMAGALRNALALLEGVLTEAPAQRTAKAA